MNTNNPAPNAISRPRARGRNLVAVYRRVQPALCRMATSYTLGTTCAEDLVTEAFFIILVRPARPPRGQSTAEWLFERVEELVARHSRQVSRF